MRGSIAAMICVVAMTMIFAQAPRSAVAEPIEVTGTWTLVGAEQSARTAGENMFVTLHSTWNVAGDFAGTYDCRVRAIAFSTGETFVSEWGLYSVSWGDYEGTVKTRNVGWSVGVMMFHLETTIVGGGTGDLAQLRGYGSVDLNFGEGTATYSLEVFWED